jgi:tetratricopeptide (TPR) repeat protein
MSDAALTISEEPPQRVRAAAAPLYDAFISYSHAKDKALAGALQSAMQLLGKPWYRRRALRLFRDDTSLTATPHLWPSIEKALGQSRFLILMASPEAAASRWVNQELAWWIEHHGPDTVLIALTAGELDWDEAAGGFRSSEALPLPPALAGKFADEPLWIDLRAYREAASPRDARFADLAASIAAALHGRAKEDLLSQEVRQQRRALRLAGSAVALLVVLLGLAGWQWQVARSQRNLAEHNLALATETANNLVFDLAQKFRNSGVPVAIVGDILARARQLQDQLTSSGEISPELRHSQAAGLIETALTLMDTGDAKGALAAERQAHDIFQSLLASAPQNIPYRRNLAATDAQIGSILLIGQGDVAGAVASFSDGKAIVATLAKEEPDNAEWEYGLADFDQRIGDARKVQGDLAGALASYRDALAIMTDLVKKAPSNTGWQRDLGIMYGFIGDVLSKQGDLAGAETAYRSGLTINAALAKSDLGNTLWQSDLAKADDRVGDVLSARRDYAGALGAYRDALAIRKALAQSDPGNGDWQRILAISNNKIGGVLETQGDLAGALASYRDGLSIAQALAQKDPGNLEWQRNLFVSYDRLGGVLRAQADLPAALATYREALTIAQTLVQKNPSIGEWQRDLSLSDGNIGEALQAQGDMAGALAAFRDSLTIARAQVQNDPTNEQWLQELGFVLPRISQVSVDVADLSGAVAADEEWAEIAQRAYNATPSDKSKSRLAAALGDLSWLLALNNQPQDSLKRADEALTLDPSAIYLQENRAAALLLLGRFDEAKAIYLANKGNKDGDKPFPQMVADDFAQLRKFGIDTPDMKRIETLLAS